MIFQTMTTIFCTQEIPGEGKYFIRGRKAKCERRKLLIFT